MERAELARRLGAGAAWAPGAAAKPEVIEERDPERFMTRFAAAVASGAEVFLGDPEWTGEVREELAALLKTATAPDAAGERERGWLMIPSGGTSGRLKFARHDQDTIAAAVRGFSRHFGLERVNAVGVLPLHHVSGLMAWMRCALTGGEYRPWSWKRLEAGDWPARPVGEWTISLVPTQLQRLLARPAAVEWLRGFRVIFLGGGPSWPELADAAGGAGLPISLSYGMTETAAMVTALRPEEFLAGARSSGAALPHARVRIADEGRVAVGGASLFRGYWPAREDAAEFVTEDLGEIDASGHLHVRGRRDAVIITGGKKVQPAEVEAALRSSGEFEDVAVLGVPDAEWGERVVACHPRTAREPNLERAVAALPAWQRPKQFLALREWPRNAQGKLNRAELRRLVESG